MTETLEDLAGVLHPDWSAGPGPKPEPTPEVRRPRGRPRKDATPGSVTPSGTGAVKAPRAEVPMPKPGAIAEAISGLYGFAGMALMPMGRPATAQALMSNAAEIGQAWEAAAAANPKIRAMLLSLMNTSTIGILVAAHIPILLTAVGESKEIAAAKREKELEDAARAEATAVSFPVGTPGAHG